MKQITEYLSTKVVQTKIKATNETIRKIVKGELDRLGHDADLNHIDVREVTDMKELFSCDHYGLGSEYKYFNSDISEWDVSNVTGMYSMFFKCENFTQDISKWVVSKVKDMEAMFCGCKKFNTNVSQWDVSKVHDMRRMFYGCENFNQDLSRWDVRQLEYNNFMFIGCPIKEEYKPHFVNYSTI